MLLMAGWLVSAWAQSPALSWRIELETPDHVRRLLETHLDIYRYRNRPEVDMLVLERLIDGVPSDARRLLVTEGYFSPKISVGKTPSDTTHVVNIRVAPGEPVRVNAVTLEITGAITGNPEDTGRVADSKKRWRLPAGSRFSQSAWTEAKDALLNAFLLDGYPAARVSASKAQVDPESAGVAVHVQIDSGPLFHFGATRITGLERYPKVLVENLNTIRQGERYTHDALLRYQGELQASGYFRSASVSVEPEPGNATATPVLVRVIEYPVMKVDLGAGYSTDTGPRMQAGLTHNNTFQPGWQSVSKLKLEGKQQSLDARLAFLPEASGWRNRLGAEAKRTDIEDLITSNLSFSLSRAWRSPGLEHDINFKFESEEQKIESIVTDNVQALSANYSWTLRRVDDLLRPRKGYLLNLQLGGAAEALLSTRSFVRSYGRGVYIQPLGRYDRLHLRAEAGAVWADARDGIPNDFLFRAGGDQSIRGYAYQSLGVQIDSAVVGARYLAVGTVEYQHDFTESWGGALFIDSGNAVDNWSDYRAVQGYGAGVRWISPAGSLNFDVAQSSEDHKVRFHFTIGARF